MSSLNPLSRTAFLGLALGVLVLSGCGQEQQQQMPAQTPPPPEVTVVRLQSQDVVLTRELPGRTRASLIAEVRPQVSGIIKDRLFVEGSVVKAGQPLYQLEDDTYLADLNSAEASLARAKAVLESARVTARRTAELVKIEAVSQQEHDNAQAALRQAEAEVLVAEAAVKTARVRLGYSRIVAPISGYIGRSQVTQGALVTTNQAEPLTTIQQLDPLYVDLVQSSSELLRIRKALAEGRLREADLPVSLRLEDGSRYEHQGKVLFSEMTVDPSTGSFTVRVEVPNPQQILMPGMYVRAEVGSGVREQALLAPQQGIMRDPKGNTSVLVVNDEGTVEARVVQVSQTIGDKWLVEGGLAEGDRVIVEGLQKVRPGIPVRVVEAPQAEVAAASGQ